MITRIEPGKRMSQAVVANGFVFLAGQVATDPSRSVQEQTRQVLGEIDRLLGLAGSSKANILSANVYLADMADFAAMNSVWDEWVHPEAKPARATVEAPPCAALCSYGYCPHRVPRTATGPFLHGDWGHCRASYCIPSCIAS